MAGSEAFDREKLGPERRRWCRDEEGKRYRKKEAPDKRGKARNLSIKSSTKACSGLRLAGEERKRGMRRRKKGMCQRMPANV